MTINELRAKRNQAWEAAKAFVETKRDKDGLLSEEDAKTYAQMEKKGQDYGAEIERMEAMMAMVLCDHLLRHRGQNGDVQCSTPVINGQA